MLELETSRLRLREATADDLPALLSVYLSNPDFVRMSEGSRGEQGYYDLDMMRRDWQVAQMMPGRVMMSIWRKETEQLIGQVDFLDENPDDGMPWLGLLMIAGTLQRQGFGTEAFSRLPDHFRADRGWTVIRLGVHPQNAPALAFWRHLSFRPVPATGDSENLRVVVMQCQL